MKSQGILSHISIPESHSPLEIEETGSTSNVQWKTTSGENVDKKVEITYLHLFLLLFLFQSLV